jgi:hypothetical protein
MEMLIYGRNPNKPCGQIFYVDETTWQPIHALMVELCDSFLDEIELEGMKIGRGDGPADQITCNGIAACFNAWMEHNVCGARFDGARLQVASQGWSMLADPAADYADSSCYVSDCRLKLWVRFLYHCGGFEVC